MRIIELKELLEGFDDNTDVSISILINGKKDYPIVTYDIGYERKENYELSLQIVVCNSDINV